MNIIQIKSHTQRELFKRMADDPAEAARRGMTIEQVKAALEAHGGGKLPHRLGPERPNRHGVRK